jgi:hypothetical protein
MIICEQNKTVENEQNLSDLPDVNNLAILQNPEIKKGYSLENVESLEAEMLKYNQAEIPLKHHFAPGLYGREIIMPKGIFAIGHAHKEDCINVVLRGNVSVFIEGKVKQIKGPCMFLGKAMDRKVGYVNEETVWITFHPTTETNIEKLEDDLLVKSDSFINFQELFSSGLVTRKPVDYEELLKIMNVSESEVRSRSEEESDLIPLPEAFKNNIITDKSDIEGMGVFSGKNYVSGDLIAPARIGLFRTPVGRYTNHSESPNCEMRLDGDGNINIFAITSISQNQECTVDYLAARELSAAADLKYLNT